MELLGVGKRYRTGGWVLRDVDLQIEPAELVVLEGTNGSGKSSLLRMIAGISRVTTGDITGRPDTISYAPDNLPGDERMSARGFLTQLARLRGLRRSAARLAADDLIERFDLVGDPDAPLRTLSLGNQQKVCLAQAFLTPCDLLVLDEPTANLDETARGTLEELIGQRRAAGSVCVRSGHPGTDRRDGDAAVYDVGDTRVVRRLAATYRTARFGPTADAADVAWPALPGVAVVSRQRDGTVEVRVAADRSDQLIETAFRSGWTLIELRSG